MYGHVIQVVYVWLEVHIGLITYILYLQLKSPMIPTLSQGTQYLGNLFLESILVSCCVGITGRHMITRV